MKATIYPSTAQGRVSAPPSKSEAHRLLLASALCEGESVVHNVGNSEDICATLDCIKALGADVIVDGSDVRIIPNKAWNLDNRARIFNCRESGSTLRFFLPVALALYGKAVFRCAPRLVQRGVEVYADALKKDGVTIACKEATVTASGDIRGGKYTLRGDVSSQYISGLLFALALKDCDSTIEILEPFESKNYVEMTLATLEKFGIRVQKTAANTLFIKGGQRYMCGEHRVDGDWSNAAFLLALNELGGSVRVDGISDKSTQGDSVCVELFKELNEKSEQDIDLANCPDLAPVMFAVAAVKGGARFVNTRRLRIKESDRAAAMQQELAKLGIRVDVHENDVVVHQSDIKTPDCVICSHNDHRIAMALSVLMTLTGGVLDGIEAMRKSYPDFLEAIGRLGVKYVID